LQAWTLAFTATKAGAFAEPGTCIQMILLI
jgi:hypothetical protein